MRLTLLSLVALGALVLVPESAEAQRRRGRRTRRAVVQQEETTAAPSEEELQAAAQPRQAEDAPAPSGGSAAGGADASANLQRSNRMEFDERLVRGEAAGTGAVILFERAPRALPPLVARRTKFLAATVDPVFPVGVPVAETTRRRRAQTEPATTTPDATPATPTRPPRRPR